MEAIFLRAAQLTPPLRIYFRMRNTVRKLKITKATGGSISRVTLRHCKKNETKRRPPTVAWGGYDVGRHYDNSVLNPFAASNPSPT